MPKPVFSVMTLIPSKSGFVWWSIEAEEGIDVADVYHALRTDGVVLCTRLATEPDGDHRVIRGREPMVLGKGLVGTITPSHVDLIEGGK